MEMQNWVREHWRGPVIGFVAFVIGVAVGGSGSESDEASTKAEAQVAGLQREIGEAEVKREVAEEEVADLTGELDEASEQAAKLEREAEGPRPAGASGATPASEPESEPVAEEEEKPAEAAKPPNVIGLPLPAARQVMKQAGYRVAPKNTDTAFGIVVEANYTICSQGKPRAGIVPVLAQKYGC